MPFLEFENSEPKKCYIVLTDRNSRIFLKYSAHLCSNGDGYSFDSYTYVRHHETQPPDMMESLSLYNTVMERLQEVLPKYYCLHYRLKCWCDDVCTCDKKEEVVLSRAQYRHFKTKYQLKMGVLDTDDRVWKCSKIEKLSSYPAPFGFRISLPLEQKIIEILFKSMYQTKK